MIGRHRRAVSSWPPSDLVAPWAAGERIYLNFAGHGEDASLTERAFGAANHARLRAIKATYDPQNLFRFNQNIPPADSRAG